MTRSQLQLFLNDLNPVLRREFGLRGGLSPSEYKFMTAKQLFSDQKVNNPDGYRTAQKKIDRIADLICNPRRKRTSEYAIVEICGNQSGCRRRIQRARRMSPEVCVATQRKKYLPDVLDYGYLPKGGSVARVRTGPKVSLKRNCETVVHEGIHLRRGVVWKAYRRSIPEYLDEGTVQILTLHIMKKLGNKWFRGHTSTLYAQYIQRVKKLLLDLGVGVDSMTGILKQAYFGGNEPEVVKKVRRLIYPTF
jgi:hypothetical protein